MKRANPSYIFKKMKTEQDATAMFGNRHTLNLHLMLTRGPVAGAWATLKLCACVGKIYRGPAESKFAECAN